MTPHWNPHRWGIQTAGVPMSPLQEPSEVTAKIAPQSWRGPTPYPLPSPSLSLSSCHMLNLFFCVLSVFCKSKETDLGEFKVSPK